MFLIGLRSVNLTFDWLKTVSTEELSTYKRFLLPQIHSNDSHQCPILAADFVIFYYGTENEEAIQAGAGSE